MKKVSMIAILCLSLCLSVFSQTSVAGEYTGIDVKSMRGFTCYNNITEDDIRDVSKMGGNTLRLMLMIHDLVDLSGYDIKPSGRIIPKNLQLIRNILEMCKIYGITLIIDVHEIPGLVRWSGWKDFRLWDPAVGYRFQEILLQIWMQLAKEFKDEPSKAVVYELLNEPEPKANDWNAPENKGWVWNNLQDRLIQEIRKIDKVHTIISSPPYGWRVNALESWVPSDTLRNDGKICTTVHMYLPIHYVFQPWVTGKADKSYPGMFPDISRNETEEKLWDRNRIFRELKITEEFQEKYGIPVFVGEFAAIRTLPGVAAWLKDVTDAFQEYGVGWTYHTHSKEKEYLSQKKACDDTFWDLFIGPPDRLQVIRKAMMRK